MKLSKSLLLITITAIILTSAATAKALNFGADTEKDELLKQLTSEPISIPTPTDFERWPEPIYEYSGGTNIASTADATGHMVDGVKVIYYKTLVWGDVVADFSDLNFRAFASIVKGRRKADHVVAWLVPGSWAVRQQIHDEGLDRVLEAAGFEIRQPGCSACLAMNDDKVPAGKYAVSTSNRNFEGRQGPGSRTILASPLVAAAAAVTGVITDPRELM